MDDVCRSYLFMFLRVDERASSSSASSDDQSKDLTNKIVPRQDGMLILSKYPPPDRAAHRDTTDQSVPKTEQSGARTQFRQMRSGTHPNSLDINVVESVVLEAIRPNGTNTRESRLANCKEAESLDSRSCLETVKQSLLSETKKRKDLEYSLELKDRMIKELKLQNQLYEKIGGKSMQLLHSPISERGRLTDMKARKPLNKQKQKEKKDRDNRIHTAMKQTIRETRPHRQLQYHNRRQNAHPQQLTETLQLQRQIMRHKKLIKTFGETFSKLARKQVARDGKQSKDLRELWDTWDRLVKDLGS